MGKFEESKRAGRREGGIERGRESRQKRQEERHSETDRWRRSMQQRGGETKRVD